MTIDPFVRRWLDVASPVIDAHAELNRSPDRWAVLVTDRAMLVRRHGKRDAKHVVLVVPRADLARFGIGAATAPRGMFPICLLAEGRAVSIASGPLLPWPTPGAA